MGSARLPHERGVSLVETMVALVIGMAVMLVIYQLYTTFEGQKRTTTGGGDAQTNGMFAISLLEREIRMAGWGLNDTALLDCATIDNHDAARNPPGPHPAFSSFAPVTIVDGGTGPGSSDRIVVRSSTSVGVAAPVIIGAITGSAADLQLPSTAAFRVNDVVVVAGGSHCTVGQVTGIDAATGTIRRSYSRNGMNPPSPWPGERQGDKLFSLGSFVHKTFQLANGNLEVLEYDAASAVQAAPHIASLKAMYGISAGGTGQNVEKWVRAIYDPKISEVDWSKPSAADARRIKAVRLAVIVRSPLLEKRDANDTCTTTTAAPAAWPAAAGDAIPVVDVSNQSDWRCYRYRSFQTIIPLRNVIWANV